MTHLSLDDIGDVGTAALDPHVATCAQCHSAVDEQRRVRDVLAGLPDPGRTPTDVVLAIEAALRTAGAAQASPAGQTVVPLSGVPVSSAPSQRGASLVARLARAPSRWVLAAAAAALVVVSAGGLLANNLQSGDNSATSAGASGELSTGGAPFSDGAPRASRAAKVVVLATGTAYTKATIVAQVDALLARTSGDDASRAVGLLATRPGLTGCLRALGAGTEPLAVDLATYDRAPAAIVVLPAAGGGREVWVVARTCTPGADGTLYYAKLP